jgi:hypothetical protein
LAQRYFPHGDAIGHALRVPGYEAGGFVGAESCAFVAADCGDVADARNDRLESPVQPAVYLPYTLNVGMWTPILVRSAAPPLTLLRAVRTQLAAVNPDQQTYSADVQ